MENQDLNNQNEEMWQRFEQSHKRGKIFGGLLVVVAGSLFLAKELGAEIPHWVLSWKMFLIALGLVIAVKNNFRQTGWIILMLIGGAFIVGDIYPEIAIKQVVWPVVIIMIGLFMIFKPRRRRFRNWEKWEGKHHYHHRFSCNREGESIHEDTLDSTSFMGGVKKNILSKNFKGGEITNVFGGAEINLSQADFEGTATLEITNVFGGTRLVVPTNWEISSDLTSVLGSIEDKRPIQPKTIGGTSKVLILKGTTFFGGIDIKSY
jgi:predicted membrane protein